MKPRHWEHRQLEYGVGITGSGPIGFSSLPTDVLVVGGPGVIRWCGRHRRLLPLLNIPYSKYAARFITPTIPDTPATFLETPSQFSHSPG